MTTAQQPEVNASDLERTLSTVCAAAAGATEGVFGPSSMTWRLDREAITFLGAGRALLLQLAHPWVAAAIADRHRAGLDRIDRFHRTFAVVYTMVFGSLEQALAVARRLHGLHTTVTGAMPTSVGTFASGSRYRANDLAALRWVYATLIDTAVLAHDMALPVLTDGERERYYAESRLFAALFGIADHDLPPDWPGFAAYNAAMLASETLTVGAAARDIARQLLSGSRGGWPVPRWYRALTTAMLPPRLREGFDLPFDAREQARADRALGRIRQLYPLLPTRLRYVAPYHEAAARLRGHPRADLPTRLLNRLWIGKPLME